MSKDKEKILSSFSDEELIKILYQYNPWWNTKKVPPSKVKEFKRKDFHKIIQSIDNEKILALIGPRRVGKSTLMYQIIETLINKNIDEKRILFFSLDEQFLTSLQNIARIIQIYSIYILKQPIDNLKEKIYIFIDEIQAIPSWEISLKKYYDLQYSIKFIVSGSSALNIQDGSSESLVGRIHHQIVLPLKFFDFLKFREGTDKEMIEKLRIESKKMRESIKQVLYGENISNLYESINESILSSVPYKEKIILNLNQYLIRGGYPENISVELSEAASNVGEYIHLVLFRDIIRNRRINNPIALEDLLRIIAKESSQIISKETLENTLDLRREALNTYIHLLKSTFLINESEFYATSRTKSIRKEKKMFVSDVGIRNILSSGLTEYLSKDDVEMGKIVETIVTDHIRRLKFNLDPIPNPRTFYWKEKYELDIVINPFDKLIAVEVKFRENISNNDLKGLETFREKFNPVISLVITKKHFEKRNSILFIPLWIFLLIC